MSRPAAVGVRIKRVSTRIRTSRKTRDDDRTPPEGIPEQAAKRARAEEVPGGDTPALRLRLDDDATAHTHDVPTDDDHAEDDFAEKVAAIIQAAHDSARERVERPRGAPGRFILFAMREPIATYFGRDARPVRGVTGDGREEVWVKPSDASARCLMLVEFVSAEAAGHHEYDDPSLFREAKDAIFCSGLAGNRHPAAAGWVPLSVAPEAKFHWDATHKDLTLHGGIARFMFSNATDAHVRRPRVYLSGNNGLSFNRPQELREFIRTCERAEKAFAMLTGPEHLKRCEDLAALEANTQVRRAALVKPVVDL